LPAIEGFDGVRTDQFTNGLVRLRTQPSNPGAVRSLRNLGLLLTGLSNAA
jgi:hypothetical protein